MYLGAEIYRQTIPSVLEFLHLFIFCSYQTKEGWDNYLKILDFCENSIYILVAAFNFKLVVLPMSFNHPYQGSL